MNRQTRDHHGLEVRSSEVVHPCLVKSSTDDGYPCLAGSLAYPPVPGYSEPSAQNGTKQGKIIIWMNDRLGHTFDYSFSSFKVSLQNYFIALYALHP